MEAAESLARKIDMIRSAEAGGSRAGASQVSVRALEMESFVIHRMQDAIPADIRSIRVEIAAGSISAWTELEFSPAEGRTSAILDRLLRGSHTLAVTGSLEGREGRGRFRLQEVRVDGVSAPVGVIEALVERYVKPRYPQVDLNAPFDLPWGIEEIILSDGEAAITF